MYLIRKGEKPRPICRTCVALHSPKDCSLSPRNIRRRDRADARALFEAMQRFYAERNARRAVGSL